MPLLSSERGASFQKLTTYEITDSCQPTMTAYKLSIAYHHLIISYNLAPGHSVYIIKIMYEMMVGVIIAIARPRKNQCIYNLIKSRVIMIECNQVSL